MQEINSFGKVMKSILAISLVVVMFILAYSALAYVNSYSKSIQPTSFRSFSVSATGKAIAIPDVAEFTYSVITEGGKDLSQLQTENIAKMNKIIDFVKSNGVKAEDIKTQNYSVDPRYQYSNCVYTTPGDVKPCPPPEIAGYSINQSVMVKVRDFTKTGILLGGVVDNGANSVSQLSFTLDDQTIVENEARAEAVQKAKDKAVSIAQAGGFKLGRLISIEENGGYNPPMPYPYRADSMAVGKTEAAVPPTVEPGSQEVQISVTLKYEIGE